jgi:hypothetical protein
MMAGHFAFAAMVKSRERQLPLWSLMLASQWLDVVFGPLLVDGVERMNAAPGTSGYGSGVFEIPYTHSLAGALALSMLFAIPFFFAWGRRAALVLGGVVISHWVLDLVVHRPDLEVVPGVYVGLGLWRVPAAAIALELAMVLLGSWLYWRAATSVTTAQEARLAGGAVLLSGIVTLALNAAGF